MLGGVGWWVVRSVEGVGPVHLLRQLLAACSTGSRGLGVAAWAVSVR